MANPKQTAKAKTNTAPAKQTAGAKLAEKAAAEKAAAKSAAAKKAAATRAANKAKSTPVVDNSLQVAHYIRNTNS